MPSRIAHFLDWAAVHAGGIFFLPNVILRAVKGANSTPRADSEEVRLVKNAMGGAKRHLLNSYDRCLYTSEAGLGYRATVEDNDKMNNPVPAKAKRWSTEKVGLDKILATVNEGRLGRQERAYYDGVRAASARITGAHVRALLKP